MDEVSLRTFGEKTNIPNRFCKHIGLHNDERIQAYLMKLSNNTNSDPGFSYETVMNTQSYTIHSGITPPSQFSLENIPKKIGITDIHGEGWDRRKISRFFNKRNNIASRQEEVPMTTSKQFEQAYIFFSMMKKIKLTTNKGKGNLFTIEYYMPSFEPQNQSVRKQHASMFKNDKYLFNPQKDLVLSMPYWFFANLQHGKLTQLDTRWPKNPKRIKKKQN